MNILLQSEIDFINKNQHLYDSQCHANSVIQNITKRYRIKELEQSIKKFKLDKTTGSYYAMFELIE